MSPTDERWTLGPFERQRSITIRAAPELTFHCPVTDRTIGWAAKDVFNPGAVVHDGRVHLLVRGEDREGRYAGVSRIGLGDQRRRAVVQDGPPGLRPLRETGREDLCRSPGATVFVAPAQPLGISSCTDGSRRSSALSPALF